MVKGILNLVEAVEDPFPVFLGYTAPPIRNVEQDRSVNPLGPDAYLAPGRRELRRVVEKNNESGLEHVHIASDETVKRTLRTRELVFDPLFAHDFDAATYQD